jgi:hypothetical protein
LDDGGQDTTGSISGTKYEDINGNGVRDTGEPGMCGRTVFIDLNGNGLLDSGEPTAVTDDSGAYTFSSLSPTYLEAPRRQMRWKRSAGGATTMVLHQAEVGLSAGKRVSLLEMILAAAFFTP